MKFQCRNARREDLDVLVRLLAEDMLGRTRERPETPLPEAYGEALGEILASSFTRILVVEADGNVAGAMQITLIPHLSYVGQRRAIFESVHVAPKFQGKGAGAALVRSAIEDVRRAGCGQVVLTSSRERADAHRFWKRMGFVDSHVGMKLHLEPTSVPAK
jgi:GNAT superfamily N-acetyltransferase